MDYINEYYIKRVVRLCDTQHNQYGVDSLIIKKRPTGAGRFHI